MTTSELDVLSGLARPGRDLATLCSLATRVEPGLLRSLRVQALPGTPASVESDLWWSSMVSGRTPQGITFAVPVLRVLRRNLRERWQAEPDVVLQAHSLVAQRHQDDPPVLRLEEEITWLATRRGEEGADEIERLLDRALVAIARDGRLGVANWWAGAWSRLPDVARQTQTAVQLCVLTSPHLSRDAVRPPDGVIPVMDGRADAALRSVPDAPVGVLRLGRLIRIGELDAEDRLRAAAMLAPDTQPRVLEVEWATDGETSAGSDVLLVPSDDVVTREVGTGLVRIRNARGTLYEVPHDILTAPLTAPNRSSAPLGATYDAEGTSFALWSSVADRVELCLVDDAGTERRIDLERTRNNVWRTFLPEAAPGQRYGFRVHGPYDPSAGLRCNPAKLLLDPYALAIDGQVDGDESLYSYRFNDVSAINADDNLGHTMFSVVVDPSFDWGNDLVLGRSYHESVIYEAHVKGLTMMHPQVPQELRGTFAGMAHPAVLDHLSSLGVTAVELMPVHQFVHSPDLLARGLTNYSGYDTIGFFAPHNAYSSAGQRGQQVREFKAMVKAFHEAGLEVVLDVVFNHTAEGNHLGPTLCFRGIDNAGYYRLVDDDPTYYRDTTGTGNSPLMRSGAVLTLIMDSLRYWVTEMHVDGFRFDLASTLARQFHEVDRLSAFFDLVQQDPVVSQVKLIAEPWDVGEGGYQVGNFPALWTEWNGKYRDTVRDFWRGEGSTLGEFASRLIGSSDLYEYSGRKPIASINYVTAHDGFTLRDLVSYNEKHNEANGEINQDGESFNRSWNCGVEGETEDAVVLALRARQQRNFLTTLLLSQGVPMIAHGDELGRTQGGNNNTWCQDNELSWVDWRLDDNARRLLAFTRSVVRLRRDHPVFRRRRFFAGITTDDVPDIAWLNPAGQPMTEDDWVGRSSQLLMVFLSGDSIPEPDSRGRPVADASFLLVLNAGADELEVTLPPEPFGRQWRPLLDTSNVEALEELEVRAASAQGRLRPAYEPGDGLVIQGRSTVLLVCEDSLFSPPGSAVP